MKKILLFVAIMSMTLTFAQSKNVNKLLDNSEQGISTVYKDGTAVVKTVYKDVKSLSPKIESALKSLATELKTTTNALWDILVRQQLVWSIVILLGLIGTILSWIHFWYRFEIACKNNWGGRNYVHYELVCLMCAGMSIVGSVLVIIHFNDMLTGFINPEFGVLKTIVEIAIKLK
jgi:hypothetical protein